MVLSEKYLKRLIREGKACYMYKIANLSRVFKSGRTWIAVERLDKQRVDHYELKKKKFIGSYIAL